MYFCHLHEKRIELNIWVDEELDTQTFEKCFLNGEHMQLIDFVYFRFDFKQQSYKLASLFKCFNTVQAIHMQEPKSGISYIDPKDLVPMDQCRKLKYVTNNQQKVS